MLNLVIGESVRIGLPFLELACDDWGTIHAGRVDDETLYVPNVKSSIDLQFDGGRITAKMIELRCHAY